MQFYKKFQKEWELPERDSEFSDLCLYSPLIDIWYNLLLRIFNIGCNCLKWTLLVWSCRLRYLQIFTKRLPDPITHDLWQADLIFLSRNHLGSFIFCICQKISFTFISGKVYFDVKRWQTKENYKFTAKRGRMIYDVFDKRWSSLSEVREEFFTKRCWHVTLKEWTDVHNHGVNCVALMMRSKEPSLGDQFFVSFSNSHKWFSHGEYAYL